MSAALPPARPYTLGGNDVLLAARRPGCRVLVVFLERTGRPTASFREVEAFHLSRLGAHLHDIKQAIAALPAAPFAFDPAAPLPQPIAPPAPQDKDTPRDGRRLHAHFAIPEGDR